MRKAALNGKLFSFGRGRINLLVALALSWAGLFGVLATAPAANATLGVVNNTINFQGRLLNAAGAVVADGTYNMEFRIYQDGTGTAAYNGGTYASPTGLDWSEDYLDSNSQGVVVKNGYFSVNLGSLCTLSGGSCQGATNTGVAFNDNTLWLSMDVAGGANATASCGATQALFHSACSPDGEMLPMKGLSSDVYAQVAAGLTSSGGVLTASSFIQNVAPSATQQTANFNILSGAATSVAAAEIQQVASATAPVLILKGGATPGSGADLLQLQSSSATIANIDSAGNLHVAVNGGVDTIGSGILYIGAVGSSSNATTIDVGNTGTTAQTINIGQAAITAGTETITIGHAATSSGADAITIGSTNGASATTIQAGTGNINLDVNQASHGTIVQSQTNNSTSAFQIQTAASSTLLNADTTNDKITVTGALTVGFTAAPGSAPTTALTATGWANANTTYYYEVTYVTADGGQTSPSPFATMADATQKTVTVSAIPTGPVGVVTGRDVYRTKAGATSAGPYYLDDAIADDTTTSYTDSTVDASLGASDGYGVNTTGYFSNPQGQSQSEVFGLGATNGATSGGTVLGYDAAGSNDSVAIGDTADSISSNSVAIGYNSQSNLNGVAIGDGANAAFTSSMALGMYATTTASNQLVIGGSNGASDIPIDNVYVGAGVTDANAAQAVTLQGSGSGATSYAGASLSVSGGAGYTSSTGSAGGTLTLAGGNAGGSGANNGANLILQGGAKTSTGTSGSVIVKPQSSNDSANVFQVQSTAGDQALNVGSLTPDQSLGLNNPSFETGTTGWTARANCTLTQTGTTAMYGSNSAQCADTASPTAATGIQYTLALPGGSGQTYTLSFYAKAASVTGANLTFGYANAGSETTYQDAGNFLGTTWERYQFTFSPATASGSSYLYFEQNDTTQRTWYMDAVQIETGTGASLYQDGTVQAGVFTGPLLVTPSSTTGDGTALDIAQPNTALSPLLLANTTAYVVGVGAGSVVNNLFAVGVPTTVDYNATTMLAASSSSKNGLVVEAASSQSVDIVQVQTSTGASLLKVGDTGATTIETSSTSTGALAVENTSGNNVLSVDNSFNGGQGQVILGASSHNNGQLTFDNSAGSTQIGLAVTATNTNSYTLDLPNAAPATGQCLQTSTASSTQLTFAQCAQANAGISEVNYWDEHTSGTLTISPATLGDVVMLGVQLGATAGAVAVTGVSGGGVTSWTKVTSSAWTAGTDTDMELWEGQVTTTGSAGVTVTHSGTTTSQELSATEFTASGVSPATNWTVVNQNTSSSSSSGATVTMPSLTTTASQELYYGYAENGGTMQTGTGTGPFVYTKTGFGDGVAYYAATASGTAYQPTYTQSPNGTYNAVAGLMIAFNNNNYVANGTSVQQANFNVQAVSSGTVTGTLEANASGTADILDLLNGSGVAVDKFSSTGTALVKPSTNATTAFQVQNSSGTNVAQIDTTGSGHVTLGASLAPTYVNEWDNHGSAITTLSDSPSTSGDLLAVAVNIPQASNSVSALSGGGVASWHMVTGYTDITDARRTEIWQGVVTTTGAGTITATYAHTASGTFEIAAEEFTTGLGANTNWSVTAQNTTDVTSASTAVTFPSVTAPATNQLYWGYMYANAGVAGSTSNFTYKVTGGGDLIAYSASTTAGTPYAPTATQTSSYSTGSAIMVTATAGTTTTSVGNTTIGPTNSTTAFQVQNASGNNVLSVDSTNGGRITVNNTPNTPTEYQEYDTSSTVTGSTFNFSLSKSSVTGDLILLAMKMNSTASQINYITAPGAGVGLWKRVVQYDSSTYGRDVELWEGVVGSGSTGSITVNFSSALAAVPLEFVADEFSATGGTVSNTTWNVVAAGHQDNTTSIANVPFPSLSATSNGQMYWGYMNSAGTTSLATSAGFQGFITGQSDVTEFDTNLTTAGNPYQPTATHTPNGLSAGVAAIIQDQVGQALTVSGASTINGTLTVNTDSVPLVLSTTDTSAEDGIYFQSAGPYSGAANAEIGLAGSLSQITQDAQAGDFIIKNTTGAIRLSTNGTSEQEMIAGTTGAATFTNTTNSTSAFQIQTTAGTPVFDADTTNGKIYVATSTTPTEVGEWDNGGIAGLATLTVSPHTVGNLMVVAIDKATGLAVQNIYGGGVTAWHHIFDDTGYNYNSVWYGTVTSTGSTTLGVNYDGSPTSSPEITATEFTAGLGASTNWSMTTANSVHNATSTTITFPTLTSDVGNTLYWGYAQSGAAATSANGGYSYHVTTQGNIIIWNSPLTALSSNSPTANTASAGSDAMGAIFTASTSALTVTGTTQLNGVVTSPVVLQSTNSISSELSVQDPTGRELLGVDTTDDRANISSLNIVGLEDMAPPTISISSTTGGTLSVNTYYYSVDAIDSNGSRTAAVQSSPNSVTTTNATSKITVSWVPVAGAVGYDVLRCVGAGSCNPESGGWDYNTVSSTLTSIIDTGSSYTWSTTGGSFDDNATGGLALQQGTALFLDGGVGNFGATISYDATYNYLAIDNSNSGGGIYLQYNNFLSFRNNTDYHVGFSITPGGSGTFQDENYTNGAFNVEDPNGYDILDANSTNDSLNTGALDVGPIGQSPANSRLFTDDFEGEGNGLYLWDKGTTVSGTSTIGTSTTTQYDGKYSAKIVGSGSGAALAMTTIPAATTVDMRAYMDVTTLGTNYGYFQSCNASNGTDGMQLYYDATNNKLAFWDGATATGYDASVAPTTGSWHEYELDVVIASGTSGSANVYVDGTNVLTKTGINTGSSTMNFFQIGDGVASRTTTTYIDDISVDTAQPGYNSDTSINDDLHVSGSATFGGSLEVETAGGGNPLLYVDAGAKLIVIGGQGITAIQPGTNYTPEVWHAMTGSYTNSWSDWSGNLAGRYRFIASPSDEVEVEGSITHASITGSSAFFTLPTGYIPASNQLCGDWVDSSTHLGALSVTTAGALTLYGLTSTTNVQFHCFISLN